jgi:hypothetical protein
MLPKPSWIAGRLIWISGIALIASGITCLYLSDKIVTGWWQGTLQAFGVGFIVGGIVDILAISGLNQRIKTEDQRKQEYNRQAEEMLRTPTHPQVIMDLLENAGDQIDPGLRWQLIDRITPSEWSPRYLKIRAAAKPLFDDLPTPSTSPPQPPDESPDQNESNSQP